MVLLLTIQVIRVSAAAHQMYPVYCKSETEVKSKSYVLVLFAKTKTKNRKKPRWRCAWVLGWSLIKLSIHILESRHDARFFFPEKACSCKIRAAHMNCEQNCALGQILLHYDTGQSMCHRSATLWVVVDESQNFRGTRHPLCCSAAVQGHPACPGQLEGPGADLQWQGHLLWGKATHLALGTVLVLPHWALRSQESMAGWGHVSILEVKELAGVNVNCESVVHHMTNSAYV